MRISRIFLFIFALWVSVAISAQTRISKAGDRSSASADSIGNGGNSSRMSRNNGWGRDTTTVDKSVPVGIFQWTIDQRLGTATPTENRDTVPHQFQNWNNTDGMNGEYSMLGNLGSPRLSRIYLNRQDNMPLMFLQPLDYFNQPLGEFRFTNTLSPVTNLAYHKCGTRQTGQDRFKAFFASNINKISGVGFDVDYLYGRGYYNNQANSQLGGKFFGYYRGEKYDMHAFIRANHAKMQENGGIERDEYITYPQSFPQKYSSKDIPTTLDQLWNRTDNQMYYLTHRYNVGYYQEREIPDSLRPTMPSDADLLKQLSDSIQTVLKQDSVQRMLAIDSLQKAWQATVIMPSDFVPVVSFIHTMQVDNMHHTLYGEGNHHKYFTNNYYADYGNPASLRDKSNAIIVRNTVGLQMREGFKKWVKMGLTLFATHEFRKYDIPFITDEISRKSYREGSHLSVGGVINKTSGSLLHYNVTGEVYVLGPNLLDYNVDGRGDLNFRLRRDTVAVQLHAYIKRQDPGFFYHHYHSKYTWYDNTNLKSEMKERVEGTLALKRTRTSLTAGFENINNYTYFAMQNKLLEGKDPSSTRSSDYTHDVTVRQSSKGARIFSATLRQDLKLGPLHWDNEFTFQKSTNEEILPLPALNVYSNAYLLFHVVKILRIQMGGDLRYFTRYYAPDYAPTVGQFALQDESTPRIKCGNYPIVNVYVNAYLKRFRFYVAFNHVNAGSGHQFLAPHYPIDPRALHFGLSWNFFD